MCRPGISGFEEFRGFLFFFSLYGCGWVVLEWLTKLLAGINS